MLDIPEILEWKTSGYESYRKKAKKKHSRELFKKYLDRLFTKDKWTVDEIETEIFWQTESLQELLSDFIFFSCEMHGLAMKAIVEKSNGGEQENGKKRKRH